MTESKLMNFKDWLIFNYEMTDKELNMQPLLFQARVHTHYTNYIEEWERGAMEETEHQEIH